MLLKQARLDNVPESSRIKKFRGVDRSVDALAVFGSIKDLTPLHEFRNLRQLLMNRINYDQLKQISSLEQLERLSVYLSPSVTDLSPIAKMSNLQILSLESSFKDVSLEPLRLLTNLRVLSISTLMSKAVNGGTGCFDSFDPLGDLCNLEYLELFAVKPRELGLEPLTRLKSLKELEINNLYSLEDYAHLAVDLPNTKGLFQTPYYQTKLDAWKCKMCGGIDYYVLFGTKRRAFVCIRCEKDKLDKHLLLFEQFKQKFKMTSSDVAI
ncbi:hypothetical protein [uncultured Desulfobulbus sp.]|uniref:hypothetical protein n=1 Tax=uncultured Desulfobulbus sp. TaxID=239745 RepID=UPI0029C75537|nr:hypothetical protein [uncultured Desulfobulbus sp.]